jgi:outer membrane biogenesis lipoprotein LolB
MRSSFNAQKLHHSMHAAALVVVALLVALAGYLFACLGAHAERNENTAAAAQQRKHAAQVIQAYRAGFQAGEEAALTRSVSHAR